MSEKYFLQKCIVAAEDAKGSYTMMSQLDVDSQTKQAYEGMANEISKQLNRAAHAKHTKAYLQVL
ncbi:MAG TPA: hypothetical protein PKX46_01825 [Clostridia bacterium]|nr:hypothetical protein [Clostridia bacterium]